MPVSYPIPSWLQPASPEQLAQLTQTAQIRGQELQLERQRLEEQAKQAEMRLAAEREESQREQLRREQQAQIANAYHQAELGLRKAQIEQQGQRLQMAVQGAAQKFQAQRDMESDAQALMASGVPEEQAYMRSALKHSARLGMSGSGIAALSKMSPAITPPKQVGETLGYQVWQVPGPKGMMTRFVDQRFALTQRAQMLREEIKGLEREKLLTEQAMPFMEAKDKQLAEKKLKDYEKRTNQLRADLEKLLPMQTRSAAAGEPADQTQSEEEED